MNKSSDFIGKLNYLNYHYNGNKLKVLITKEKFRLDWRVELWKRQDKIG